MRTLWFWLALTWCAWAHGIDDALLTLEQRGQHWSGTWRSPLSLWKGYDQNQDGQLSRQEVEAAWPRVTAEGFSLQGVAVQLGEGGLQQGPAQLLVPIRFEGSVTNRITLDYRIYLKSVPNQKCLAVITSSHGTSGTLLLTPEMPSQSLELTPAQTSSEAKNPGTLSGFFWLGVEHILTGYDHLLFLLTLVIVGGNLWRWVKVITAFSVSHSISLALAVFGVVHLAPAIIEPLIALSITVSAAFSFRAVPAQKLSGGWLVAFGFGLIHGLGFAGVLAEMQLSGRRALLPLVGFNLGVEAGQLAVALALLPVVRALCRNQKGARVRQLITALAGLMGLYWFAFGTP
ncbi:HupE/UreJ family protein [bacterium]|nr:HupE/UreJ family protein [bacterium]